VAPYGRTIKARRKAPHGKEQGMPTAGVTIKVHYQALRQTSPTNHHLMVLHGAKEVAAARSLLQGATPLPPLHSVRCGMMVAPRSNHPTSAMERHSLRHGRCSKEQRPRLR